MKKKAESIFIVLFLLIISVELCVNSQNKLEQQSEKNTSEIDGYFLFSCRSGDEIRIKYNHKNNEVILLFQDQRYFLQRAISGSGARYVNEDESMVFWEHQGEARLEIDGEIVAQNCVLEKGNMHWKEVKSNGMLFRYPESLKERYIFLQKWPPEIKILTNRYDFPAAIEIKNGKLTCQTGLEKSSLSRRFYQKDIHGRAYCIRAESEGAAGSVYTDYTYFTIYKKYLISINFVLRFPNCFHYSEPQRIECTTERETFDIDYTINKIVESISFTNYQ